MKSNLRRAPVVRENANNVKPNIQNQLQSQKRCFLGDCGAVLPQNHQYNRCNNCFNTKCLDCYKKHTPSYKYKRCPDCYSKFRRK